MAENSTDIDSEYSGPQRTYEEILSELERHLDSSQEHDTFIQNRLHELNAHADIAKLSHCGTQTWHRGFLTPASTVRRSFLVPPLCVDDPAVYTMLLETLKEYRRHPGYAGKTLREIVPLAIQTTIARYFGNAYATTSTERRNQALYIEAMDADKDTVSLKELKGKNCGVCVEKSAIAQNLMQFLGADSTIILADVKLEEEQGPHTFVLLRTPRGHFLYEPTNPRIIKQAGTISQVLPAYYQLTAEQYDALLHGGSVDVQHVDQSQAEDGAWQSTVTTRHYGP